MNNPKPPKFLIRFFKWFCSPELHRFIEGDLQELYHDRVRKHGKKRADQHFFWDVLLLLRPGIIRSFKIGPFMRLEIFRHNFLITWRGFMRNKSTFLINLIGLSTGLACILLIYLWVNDEFQIDKLHYEDEQLYQVMHNLQFPDQTMTVAFTPIPLAKTLLEELPEVESAMVISQPDKRAEGLIAYEEHQILAEGIFAGVNYFEVLSFPLLHGNSKEVLVNKNSIVLSETLAQKIFRNTDHVVGKTIEWRSPRFEGVYQVSGIFRDLPANSTTQFDFLFPIQVLLDYNEESKEWYNSHAETLLRLQKGTDIAQFNLKIADFIDGRHDLSWLKSQLFVQQFSRKYLFNHYENGIESGGRIAYVRLFSFIGLFILLIACINFMNLSTARASRRMKEIGIKKTIGAQRKILAAQFIGEALLVAVLASIAAIVWVIVLLPRFNMITGKALSLLLKPEEILIFLGIIAVAGLIAGSYPALYLSGLNIVTGIKGRHLTSGGEPWIRKGLVVFQFTLSVLFIIGVLIISRQVEFIQNRHLGYEQENIITFVRKGKISKDSSEVFIAALKALPGVVNASSVDGDFVEAAFGAVNFSWEGKSPEEQVPYPSPEVSYDFVETLGMKIVAGRSFSLAHLDDYSKIMINEAAAKMMGMVDPVGRQIKYGNNDRQIIGVVKDFHLKSLHHAVEPLFFRFVPGGSNIVVKVQSGMAKTTIPALAETYGKFHSGYPLDFTFLDDDFQQHYNAEKRVAILSKYFSVLAILISCLGLLGLTMFTVERRSKEVGIRKVLGASVWSLVSLLNREFFNLIFMGILIATPISYWLAKTWLNNYAFRIDLQWWFFALAAALTLLLAWVTVVIHTIRAALVNPVVSIKSD